MTPARVIVPSLAIRRGHYMLGVSEAGEPAIFVSADTTLADLVMSGPSVISDEALGRFVRAQWLLGQQHGLAASDMDALGQELLKRRRDGTG